MFLTTKLDKTQFPLPKQFALMWIIIMLHLQNILGWIQSLNYFSSENVFIFCWFHLCLPSLCLCQNVHNVSVVPRHLCVSFIALVSSFCFCSGLPIKPRDNLHLRLSLHWGALWSLTNSNCLVQSKKILRSTKLVKLHNFAKTIIWETEKHKNSLSKWELRSFFVSEFLMTHIWYTFQTLSFWNQANTAHLFRWRPRYEL